MQSSPPGVEGQEGGLGKLEAVQAEVADLQRRVDRERQAFAQISSNLIASTTHFDLQVSGSCTTTSAQMMTQSSQVVTKAASMLGTLQSSSGPAIYLKMF